MKSKELNAQEEFKKGVDAYHNYNYTEAVSWYKKAAEQGQVDAQYCLGFCYFYGDGVTQDDSQAVYWYEKAAEQGHTDAQFELGEMYENGDGVTQDDEQAVYWYKKAAEQGYAYAIAALKRLEEESLDED